jgi:hypothetical protein
MKPRCDIGVEDDDWIVFDTTNEAIEDEAA